MVSRLVPHKRVDVLLAQLAITVAAEPKLRVDIVGDGPERTRLQILAAELGLGDVVTFHGYQPDEVRDELLRRAWLTMSTSQQRAGASRSSRRPRRVCRRWRCACRACATRS